MTKPKTKILFVIPGKKDDSKNMIFARRQIDSLPEKLIDKHIFFLEHRSLNIQTIKEFFRLSRTIEKISPDIVHAHYGTVTSFVTLLASGNRKFVMSVRGNDVNPDFSLSPFRRQIGLFLTKFSALFAQKIFSVSLDLKKKLWKISQANTEIIPSGIDLNHFSPTSTIDAKKKLDYSETDKVMIFYAGNSDPVKREDLADKVVQIVKTEFPNLIYKKVKRNVDPKDMPLHLSASDCLILTSENEGSPNIIKEASACNLPVVSFDVGDVSQILKNDRISYVDKSRNCGNLANAAIKILQNGLRSSNRENISYLSIDVIASKLTKIYLNL